MQVHQRLTEDAPDPHRLNRHVPRDLSTIALKCLERDPNRRFSTAQKVVEELDRYSRGEPIKSRPISRVARLTRWCQRKPALATAAALMLLLSIAGPLVAWRIELQRQRLGELVNEKNNLIAQISQEQEASVRKQSQLQLELDLWTGQANPWELWPPNTKQSPQIELLDKAYRRHYEEVQSKLESYNELTIREATATRLGLAVLAESTGHSNEALQEYLVARNLLRKEYLKNPRDFAIARTLADCEMHISLLYGNENKQEAEKSLAEASKLYKLLGDQVGDKYSQVAHVEAEMRRAVYSGFEDAASQLEQAALIAKELESNWTGTPMKFYEQIFVLAGREPLLTKEK